MDTPVTDAALLERLSNVLHDLGLPCACQAEVERTVAVFAEFESRRTRRRLLTAARERVLLLREYLDFLQDLEQEDSSGLDAEELSAVADTFRVIAAAAAEGAANLELLAAFKDKAPAP
jgi:hypothetical protein